MDRATPFVDVVTGLARSSPPGRCSADPGRVGIGQSGDEPGFQLSPACRLHRGSRLALETTLKRGIINTRDEPHADPDRYRRLHVIIGDANLAETATLPEGRHDRAGPRPHRGRRRPLRRNSRAR